MNTGNTLQKALLPIASLVFCLQALALLGGLDPRFALTPAGGWFLRVLLLMAAIAFTGFMWVSLRGQRGAIISVAAYLAGFTILMTGAHERQAHVVYRVACNVGGSATACAAAARSAERFGWTTEAATYATRACVLPGGDAVVDCDVTTSNFQFTRDQTCRMAKLACESGDAELCDKRPLGCEPHREQAVTSCTTGDWRSCMQLADRAETPMRAASYAAMACEFSAGKHGCFEAVISGFVLPRERACETVLLTYGFEGHAQMLRPQCQAILSTPF